MDAFLCIVFFEARRGSVWPKQTNLFIHLVDCENRVCESLPFYSRQGLESLFYSSDIFNNLIYKPSEPRHSFIVYY